MTGRRNVLRTLLGGFWALVSCRTAPRDPSVGAPVSPAVAPEHARSFGRRFLEDFRRTSSRTYSEEGIPVFLVGEDLVGGGGTPPVPSFRPETDAARLAADLRRGASALARARLATSEDEVGKLVEVLAERDFGTLRTPR